MTAVHSNFPRRLKALSTLARGVLYVLAMIWITLAVVWGVLHFLIVPRIGEVRPWLEQQLSQRLHIAVRIGSLVAKSNGLIPSVELRDVSLIDATGREALHLPVVLAALSPRSLLGVRFEQLYVEGPVLEVRRSSDGRIWVAGLEVPEAGGQSSAGLDWLFSQKELVVRHGSVRWIDALRGVPPLALDDVDIVVRNRGRSHAVRVDANPPDGWGSRVTVMGRFVHPLFSAHRGDWKSWSGTLFAQAGQLDTGFLRNYVDLGVDLQRGVGAVRCWLDMDRQAVTRFTTDLALQQVVLKVSPQLDALALAQLSGRFDVQLSPQGYSLATQNLAFDTQEGLHWPGGNVRVSLVRGATSDADSGELNADHLDLAALASIAARLPLGDVLHAQAARFAPTGQVEKLRYTWRGAVQQPLGFSAAGRVTQLTLAAQPQTPEQLQSGTPGVPGVQGAQVDFGFNQSEGHASVAINNGVLVFPGVFELPQVPMELLSGDVDWKVDARRTSVLVNHLRFMNADAQGDARISWQTADVPHGAPASLRFPGVLDLQGTLSRADVAAVPRYMPVVLNQEVRNYLQRALLGGSGSNVRFKVRGDLARFPFADARTGDFAISADVQNATYAYAPAEVLPKGAPPWPVLSQISTTLVIDHDTLQLRASRGLVAPGTGLTFARTDASITKLYTEPQLLVSAEAHGPLTEALTLVNSTQIGQWTDAALARAQASGSADYKFRLALPIEQIEKATVQGTVALAGNDFQFSPEVPRLSRVKGAVAFTDTGFSVAALQARALGGDVRLDGGLSVGPPLGARAAPSTLRIQGVATAEGLRLASELGSVSRWARYLSGSAAYNASVSLHGGVPELVVSSALAGMGVALPPPFGKAANSVQLVRYENSVLRTSQMTPAHLQDQVRFDIGRMLNVVYVRDISGPEPKLERGSIGFGLAAGEDAPLPPVGVVANVHIDQLDVDAWTAVLSAVAPERAGHGSELGPELMAYLPTHLALRAAELTVQGHKISRVLIGAGREDLLWRINVDATELNGYLEYRQRSGAALGRLYARLAYLTIGQMAEQDVESLLDQQPASIPALDIVVNDMELRGKKIGRVEIQAVNSAGTGAGVAHDGGRDWQLNRFNISTPEASLTASGNWTDGVAPAGSTPLVRGVRERRRTALTFKLDMADSGELLSRLGMPGVLAKGRGSVEGHVAWLGSPFSPDYPNMSGGFHVDVETGQFLKADPGIAKLLGVLSLQSLPRRLALDFRDVFSDGFAFDFVRGDAQIEAGIARTNNLQMKGVNAAVMMEGQADLDRETQSLKVVVIPEINAGSASLLATTINPLVGLTTFLAQVILRRPLIEANTQEFLIDGTWIDPHVTKVPHQ